MLLIVLFAVASLALRDEPFYSYEERSLQHVVNAARMDVAACVQTGLCAHQLHKVCGDGAHRCSLDALTSAAYPSARPLRHSRATSDTCRRHLEALERCGGTGLEHTQPQREPCDGSTTAARVRAACGSTAGSFAETLAVSARADALLPLTSWLCDAKTNAGEKVPQECAAVQRGVAGVATHRENLLDPRTADGALEFTTIGTAHHLRANGESSWCVELTSGSCADSDAPTTSASAIHSGTHIVGLAARGMTSFMAAFWPERDVGSVEAKVVIEGDSFDMSKQYPASTTVRGHYAVELPRRDDARCRAYHFAFELTDRFGFVTVHRFPEHGELLTHGEGTCREAFDPLVGLSSAKRAPFFTGTTPDQLIVRANVTVTAINLLERLDDSRRGTLVDNSIAATESVNVTVSVTNLGYVNETTANTDGTPHDVRVVYFVNCSVPGVVGAGATSVNDATLSNVQLRAFNGTSGSFNLSDGDVGSFMPSGLGGVFTTRSLPDLHLTPNTTRAWFNTLSFLINTRADTATGNIVCTATAQQILDVSTGVGGIVSPIFLNTSSIENGTATSFVERRVDLVISMNETTTSVLAANRDARNRVTQFITVTNRGPIDATNVVVGIKPTHADGVELETALLDANVVADRFLPDLFHWTVGNLSVGESATTSLTFDASSYVPVGAAIFTEAFVSTSTEKTIFIMDDIAKAGVRADAEVDFHVGYTLTEAETTLGARTATLTIFITNNGPSPSAVTTLVVAVAAPESFEIVSRTPSKGDYIRTRPNHIYPHKRFFAFGRFHYWLVPSLGVGETETLVFVLRSPTHADREPAPLRIGAAVLRREIREHVVHDADDQILVTQYI